MSIAATGGAQLNGPSVASRSLTVMGWIRYDAYDGVIIGIGSFATAAELLYLSGGTDLNLYSDANGGPVLAAGVIKLGEWYRAGFTVDAAGVGRAFISKPRPVAGAAAGKSSVQFFDANTNNVASATVNVNALAFDGGFNAQGAIAGLAIWQSVLTDAEIVAACQPTVDSGSSWGSGGLPTTPWAYYELSTNSDLSDHSGNGRPALTVSGTVSTDTGPTTPADPNTLIGQIFPQGDSLTTGFIAPSDSSGTQSYPVTVQSLRPADTVANTGGNNGWTVDQLLNSALQAQALPAFAATSTHYNLCLLQIGTNNLAWQTGGPATTPATALSDLAKCVTLLQALGYVVLVGTLLPWDTLSFNGNAERLTFNTSVLANAFGADGIVDNASDTWFDPTDSSKYSDAVHLTGPVGYPHLGAGWNAGIDAYLATFSGGSDIPLTLTVTQLQTPVRVRGAALRRTVSQVQSPSRLRATLKVATAVTLQTATRSRNAARRASAVQAQTATRLRLVSPIAKNATNSQTASLAKGQGYLKTLTVTAVQTLVLARALGLARSITQVQTLARAAAIARALSAVQTQARTLARAIAAGRSVTGTQTASFTRAVNRLLSVTSSQTATRSRALTRQLSQTATQTLAATRVLAKALGVTNAQTPGVQVVPSGGGPINYPMTIAATVSQTIALARACAKPLATLQAQSITRARLLQLLAKSATQTQAATAVKGQGFFKTLTAGVAQTATRVLGIAVARSATQAQAPAASRGFAVARSAIATQTATRGRELSVSKTANQTQGPALSKGRGFFVTLAAVAIQVATFVRNVGVTRFATQAHALDIQSEVAGGGFPILSPMSSKYVTRGRDLRLALYTTQGRDLRS